ncbi:MAG: hypothetical protein O2960_11320 [Verrucomicrobia bacterium]|nr:hypothetical protein [Verrucomicrobiota bacterium]
MHQIKIFKALETETPRIEDQVNSWLAESKVRVINMFGNISPQTTSPDSNAMAISRGAFPPSDVMLVVLYEKPD